LGNQIFFAYACRLFQFLSLMQEKERTMKHEVFRNVVRCKEVWVGLLANPNEGASFALNMETGEMQPMQMALKEKPSKNHWLKVEIKEKRQGRQDFYLADLDGNPLNFRQVDAFIWEVATETLKALDDLVNSYYNAQLPAVFSPMTRVESERALKKRQIGTYMLNQADATLEDIAESLSRTNHTIVVLYLLTILEKKNHPVQYVVVASKWGWTILQDLPILTSSVYTYFADFTSLLETLLPEKKFLLEKVES